MNAPAVSAPSLSTSAVALTRALIRIDTSNSSAGGSEAAAADLVAATVRRYGGDPLVLAGSPGRDNVVVRIAGREPGPGVLVHAHLDTVPADPIRWRCDPWSADIRDGCIVGVGAVDMKAAAASMLAVAAHWFRRGVRPRHDVVFAWVADEEAGGHWGARWLAAHHPDLLAGCDTAIGEVGGFAVPLRRGVTVYPVMTAERGHAVMHLGVTGRARHAATAGGGRRTPLVELAAAVATIGSHPFRRHPTRAGEGFLHGVADALGLPPVAAAPPEARWAALGGLAQLVEPGMRGSATPTVFRAGECANVSAGSASAVVDCRFVPGHRDDFLAELADIVPAGVDTRVTPVSDGFDLPWPGRAADAIAEALRRADPGAVALPYGVAASTDGATFAGLGLRPLGFTPLGLPAGFPFGELFHGVDERVPVAAVEFGVAVLADLLASL